jgi:hypothetical protein
MRLSFSRDATNFENNLMGRTKQLPEEIRALFRTLKPYRGGNNALWALNEIDNADKHALLGIGSGAFIFGASFLLSETPQSFGLPIRPMWDSANQEIELGIFPIQENSASKVDFGLFVAFDEIEVAHGEPVVMFLRQLARGVEYILNAIDSECRRIGVFK